MNQTKEYGHPPTTKLNDH